MFKPLQLCKFWAIINALNPKKDDYKVQRPGPSRDARVD